ncbi:ATP-dependent DNA/RNA helicase [Dispira simplex]|nr:ATP-dependent DNA/RNA helicase [Dispira simplex]
MADTELLETKETFGDLDLDDRLVRAVQRLGFHHPTLIQSKGIPLLLAGKDVLARARTGSGKTAAYCLPLVHRILHSKALLSPQDPTYQITRALILVPTRELAEQVYHHLQLLLTYCSALVRTLNLGNDLSVSLQKPLLKERPDVIISTPKRILVHLDDSNVVLKDTVEYLVVDEADLVLSYGHGSDIARLQGYLPTIYQAMLMSATLTHEMEKLKKMVLRNPAVIKLEEGEQWQPSVQQYSLHCSETDKFLFTYVILKLQLIPGKGLLFVNDIDRCYRLKLFLEHFGVHTCVLNSELPFNSRRHIVDEFNDGKYNYLIATDEKDFSMENDSDDDEPDSDAPAKPSQTNPSDAEIAVILEDHTQPGKRKNVRDKEYGVSRGIDFQNVAVVINFDFPQSVKSYTHRIGRTGRGNAQGSSLSFVVPKNKLTKHSRLVSGHDEQVFARVVNEITGRGQTIEPFQVDESKVQAFRYRMEDVLRMTSRVAVREARVKDLKREILASEKLAAYFEDKPKDLEYLRHDRALQPLRTYRHLKDIPRYLLGQPAVTSTSTPSDEAVESTAENSAVVNDEVEKILQKSMYGSGKELAHGKRHMKRKFGAKSKNDPLRSFKLAKRKH